MIGQTWKKQQIGETNRGATLYRSLLAFKCKSYTSTPGKVVKTYHNQKIAEPNELSRFSKIVIATLAKVLLFPSLL